MVTDPGSGTIKDLYRRNLIVKELQHENALKWQCVKFSGKKYDVIMITYHIFFYLKTSHTAQMGNKLDPALQYYELHIHTVYQMK
jgi:hypothetical protein